MHDKIISLDGLPIMPDAARQLLYIRNDPHAGAYELAQIIEQDPALTAQVLRYANSPMFARRGDIDSIQAAVARVLGFDFVLHLALGMLVGSSMKTAPVKIAGMSLWEHAVYSAQLSQRLAEEMPMSHRPQPGVVYLAGLLHDIGHLMFAYLFPERMAEFSASINEHPEQTVLEREASLFEMSHAECGALLLDVWGLPQELVAAARYHHDCFFSGEHEAITRIVLLSDRLLMQIEQSDAEGVELPEQVIAALGLTQEQINRVWDGLLEQRDGLDAMVKLFA
ncbi:HDOD domain-containing protein [Candidatus Reidiella endopervernicosa]|uniref:HDOD domain-containing protein n=1 Tax=Candidatus Reidiella endopervernicosa TaxID=2738883 RepID=A0A6N0HUM9_9GAMM|nr:HDOD domain-containing protein [Candidatus Reidiella endopervernicosa]QKQ25866.1 HDOD domain-containing protein [Candidatus Reidiella endopervernicosa]